MAAWCDCLFVALRASTFPSSSTRKTAEKRATIASAASGYYKGGHAESPSPKCGVRRTYKWQVGDAIVQTVGRAHIARCVSQTTPPFRQVAVRRGPTSHRDGCLYRNSIIARARKVTCPRSETRRTKPRRSSSRATTGTCLWARGPPSKRRFIRRSRVAAVLFSLRYSRRAISASANYPGKFPRVVNRRGKWNFEKRVDVARIMIPGENANKVFGNWRSWINDVSSFKRISELSVLGFQRCTDTRNNAEPTRISWVGTDWRVSCVHVSRGYSVISPIWYDCGYLKSQEMHYKSKAMAA